jgi:hypothetical protein
MQDKCEAQLTSLDAAVISRLLLEALIIDQ